MTAFDELRGIAATLPQLDVDCYRRHGRDPHVPVIGLGAPDARWCFFGRDPGEEEVRLQRPFVGTSGRRIRAVMHEAGVADGDVFWMNTVPFKPKGNKPWPLSVQRRCRPAQLQLLDGWRGTRVLAFGEAAFRWFGLADRAVAAAMDAFWAREDRYRAEFTVTLALPSGRRSFTLCPLPHPSGANARWARDFPDLLRSRLAHGA